MGKIKLEQIVQEAESRQWKVISTSYKNLDTEMEFQCPEGHTVLTTYALWRTHHKCPICDNPQLELSTKVIPKKKDTVRILALDQATHLSGWCIFDGNVVIKYGVVETSGELEKRINELKIWLANMIEIWKPNKIIMEDIQLQDGKNRSWDNDDGNSVVNVDTFKTLAQLQGVLKDYLYEKSIRYEIVKPATWRKSCEIKGLHRTDKKKSAQLKVNEWFGIDVTNDEADAICIGYYATAAEKKNTKLIDWG